MRIPTLVHFLIDGPKLDDHAKDKCRMLDSWILPSRSSTNNSGFTPPGGDEDRMGTSMTGDVIQAFTLAGMLSRRDDGFELLIPGLATNAVGLRVTS